MELQNQSAMSLVVLGAVIGALIWFFGSYSIIAIPAGAVIGLIIGLILRQTMATSRTSANSSRNNNR